MYIALFRAGVHANNNSNVTRLALSVHTSAKAANVANWLLCTAHGSLSDDAVWRLSVWRLSRTSGRRAAYAADWLDGAYWLIGPGSAGLAQGCCCALPLQAWAGHIVAAARLRLVTLRAKLSGAVYCNRSCLWVCLSVYVCLWVCYHDNSKLRALILTKLGL